MLSGDLEVRTRESAALCSLKFRIGLHAESWSDRLIVSKVADCTLLGGYILDGSDNEALLVACVAPPLNWVAVKVMTMVALVEGQEWSVFAGRLRDAQRLSCDHICGEA